MALSKPANTTKDSLFSCPICLETLKSPKILPCLHTFCEQCIQERILTSGRNKENEVTEFVCPVCQTVVKPNNGQLDIDEWASGLQTNHVILTMMAVAQNDQEQECHPCKRHGLQTQAKFWCKECVEAFCEECNAKHGWMKLLSSHVIVSIEDFGCDTSGIDLNVITNRCLKHPVKTIDSYCFDHKQLCCVLCLTLNHRGCMNVKAIEHILESEKFWNTRGSLADMKDTAMSLLEIKEKQLNSFNLNIKNTEAEAANFVKMLKSKLDCLSDTFTNQLCIYRDEKTSNMQIRIRLLKQFIQNLDHWIVTSKITDEVGTKTQLFIYLETIKEQIDASLQELDNACRNGSIVKTKFCENGILQKVTTITDIGTFKAMEQKLIGELSGILKIGRTLVLKNPPTFDDLTVQKVHSYFLKGTKLTCGVDINNGQYIILGDVGPQKKLHVFDKHTGSILSTTEFEGEVKRVCFVENLSEILISCYSCQAFKAELRGKQISEPELVFDGDCIGALLPCEKFVYCIVDNAINKFISTAEQNKMVPCFKTNCTGRGLSGLDVSEGNLVYTTASEIKCATVKGEELFSFHDQALGAPQSLAVLPSGLVLIINHTNDGSLHVLSEDGRKLKMVLKKFENIKKPKDIWLDTDKETIYVVGGEYIEVYKITSD